MVYSNAKVNPETKDEVVGTRVFCQSHHNIWFCLFFENNGLLTVKVNPKTKVQVPELQSFVNVAILSDFAFW